MLQDSIKKWLFHDEQSDFELFKKHMNKPKIKLPKNFAQDLFYLELECEEPDVSENIVNQLLALYKIGTEYFESINSQNYRYFMEKSQRLLIRHNIQEAIYQPSQNPKLMVQAFQQEASIISTLHTIDLQNQSEEINRRIKNRQCNKFQ